MSWLGGRLSSLTGQLSNLTKEVLSEGREEVGDSQTELGIANDNIRYLQRQCTIHKQEVEKQRLISAELEERCQAAELQISAISSQYRSIIQKKEEEIKRLKQSFQELDSESHPNISSTLSDIRYSGQTDSDCPNDPSQEKSHGIEGHKLHDDDDIWQSNLASSTEFSQKLQLTVEAHQHELASLQDHYANSLAQVQQQYKKEISSLQEKLNYYTQNNQDHAFSADVKIFNLKKELDDAREQLGQKAVDIETLQNEKLENQRTIHLLKLQIKKLQAENSESKQDNKKVHKELCEVQNSLDSLNQEHLSVKEQLQLVTKKLEENPNVQDTGLSQLQEKLKVAEQMICDLQAQHNQACNESSTLKLKLLEHLQNQHSHSSEILQDVQTAWDRVSEEISQTHFSLSEGRRDIVNRIAEIGEKKITVEEKIKYLEDRSKLLSVDIKEIIESSDGLQRITENSGAGNEARNDIFLAKDQTSNLNPGNSPNRSLTQSLSHFKDLDQESLASVMSEISLQRKELDEQVKKLQQQVDSYEREIEHFEIVDWKSERSAVEELLLKLKAQVRQKEQYLSVLIAQKGLLEVKKKEPDRGEMEGSIKDDVSRDEDFSLSRLAQEIEELTQGNAQLENERDVLWTEKEILINELQTLRKMYDDLNTKVSSHEKEQANTYLCPDCQSNDRRNLLSHLADKDNQLLQLTKDKDALEVSLVELDQQHQEAINHILSLKDKLTKENKELVNKLEEQNEENNLLRTEIEKLQNESAADAEVSNENQAAVSKEISGLETPNDLQKADSESQNYYEARFSILEEQIKVVEMGKAKLEASLIEAEQDRARSELEKARLVEENIKLEYVVKNLKEKVELDEAEMKKLDVQLRTAEEKYLEATNKNLVTIVGEIPCNKQQLKKSASETQLNLVNRTEESLLKEVNVEKLEELNKASEKSSFGENHNFLQDCSKINTSVLYHNSSKNSSELKDQTCQTEMFLTVRNIETTGNPGSFNIAIKRENLLMCDLKEEVSSNDKCDLFSSHCPKESEEPLLKENDLTSISDFSATDVDQLSSSNTDGVAVSCEEMKHNQGLTNASEHFQHKSQSENFGLTDSGEVRFGLQELNLQNQELQQKCDNQSDKSIWQKSNVITPDYLAGRSSEINKDMEVFNDTDKLSHKFHCLEDKIRSLELEKEQMLSVLNEKSKECSSLKAEVHKLFGVVSAEKQALVKLQQDNHKLSTQKEAEEKEMTRETVHNLCQLIRDKDLEIEALQQKNQTLLAVIQQSSPDCSNMASLLQEHDTLVKQLVLLQADREQIINSLNKKHEESVKYHKEVQRLTELLASELQKYDSLHQDHSLVSQQYEEKQKSLINTQNELIALKQRVTELEKQHIDLRQKYSQLLSTMNSDNLVHINKEELNAKLDEAVQLKENLKEKENLIFEKDCIIHQMSQTIQRQKEDIDFKDNEISMLRKHLEGLTAQLVEARKECVQLKKELESTQQRLNNIQSEITILKELNERLNITVKEKEFEIKMLKEKVETFTHIIQENTNANKPSDVECLLAENNVMQQRAHQFHQERDEAVLALNQRQQENRDLKNEVQQLREREGRLTSELERLKNHLIQVEEGYTKEVLKAEEREKELRNRLLQAEERAQCSTSAVHNASQQASLQVESLQEQLGLVAKQRDKALARICHLEDQVQQHATSLANLQAVLEQFQKDHEREIHNAERAQQILLDNERHRVKDLQEELHRKEVQLSETSEALYAASRLSEQLDYKEEIISELKKEVSCQENSLQRAHENINYLKTNTEGKVDRQVMKNLVLGYFGAPLNQKSEVVRLLARVLDFNREEMIKAGIKVGRSNAEEKRGFFFGILSRISPSTESSGPSSLETANSQSLSALFVQFLQNESQPIYHMPLPAEDMAREVTSKSRASSRSGSSSSSSSSSRSSGISLHPYTQDHLLMRPISTSFPTFAPVPVPSSSDSAKTILQEVLN